MSAPLFLAMYQEELRAWNWHINRVPVWDPQMGELVGYVYITPSGDLVPESAERQRLRFKYADRFYEYARRNMRRAQRSESESELLAAKDEQGGV